MMHLPTVCVKTRSVHRRVLFSMDSRTNASLSPWTVVQCSGNEPGFNSFSFNARADGVNQLQKQHRNLNLDQNYDISNAWFRIGMNGVLVAHE